MSVRLEKIFIYPLKSGPGYAVEETVIVETGFEFDRFWMLVNAQGHFITQREKPILNTLEIKLFPHGFYIYHPNRVDDFVLLNTDYKSDESIYVKIFDSEFYTEVGDQKVSNWFSEFLQEKVILTQMKPRARIKRTDYWPISFPINFTDGYPIHVINLESVLDVANRCGENIHPYQFRPNILLSGLEAYQEDHLKKLTIGDQSFSVIKKCERCIMSTLPPHSSQFGKNPLKILSEFRREAQAVHFGIYLIPDPLNSEIRPNIRIEDKIILEF
ncbi:MAG: MOSC domain-containing protein [Saprospiraceae bacterium]|nr:MOSC domain-containing protein [Saprospiraceae bacterium]